MRWSNVLVANRAFFTALLAALSSATAFQAQADLAAITSQNAGTLTLIDTDRAQQIASVPLPGKPAAVAVDSVRGRIMVIAVETASLHVLDLSGQTVAVHAIGGAPFGLAIRPDTGTALVTDAGGVLVEFAPLTGQRLRDWRVGAMASGVAVAEDVIVTADRDDDRITIIRGNDAAQVSVGHHPFGVTIRQGRAFVTNVLSDSVSVVDLDSGKVVGTIPTEERPYAVAFAGARGFVTNQYAASITVFDADSLAPVATIPTDEYPEGIAATADGTQIVVANWFSDTVQILDSTTLQITATVEVPAGPRAFGRFIAPPTVSPF